MNNNVSRQYSETKNKTKIMWNTASGKKRRQPSFRWPQNSMHANLSIVLIASLSFCFVLNRLHDNKKWDNRRIPCIFGYWRLEDFYVISTCLVDLYSVLLSLFWLSSSHSMNIVFCLNRFDTNCALFCCCGRLILILSFMFAHSIVCRKELS